jgi:hypothetical protein
VLQLLGYPLDTGSVAQLPAVPERLDPTVLASATAAGRYTAVERWRDRAGQARGQLRHALARFGTRG